MNKVLEFQLEGTKGIFLEGLMLESQEIVLVMSKVLCKDMRSTSGK